jgi:DNA-binding XRE family transcriptional regulator
MGDEKSSDAIPCVQLSAKFQLAAGDLVQLPSAELWNGVRPKVDSRPTDSKGGGYGCLSLEELNHVIFVHTPMLDMLNSNCKDAVPPVDYAGDMETMGDRIRLLRQSKSLTQEQLGERVGVSKVSVSQWETGSTANIRLKTFLTLCEELGTSPQYLIFGPERPGAARRRAAS